MTPNIELPAGASTPLLLFAITVVTSYFTQEFMPLRWFAASAFAFFVALGPVRWLSNTPLDFIDSLFPLFAGLRIAGIVVGLVLVILGIWRVF